MSLQIFFLYLLTWSLVALTPGPAVMCSTQRGLQSLRASRATAWLERAFGAALVFFGARLLLARK